MKQVYFEGLSDEFKGEYPHRNEYWQAIWMKFTTINLNIYVIIIEVPVSYHGILPELDELFLLSENS